MEIIDTHTHVFLEEFDIDRLEVVENALKNKVVGLVLPNIDCATTEAVFMMSNQFPGTCFPAIGLHPCSVKANFRDELAFLKPLAQRKEVVAIGETGLDLYWDKTTLAMQIDALKEQIQWSVELNKPIIFHVREAFDEIFAVMNECYQPGLRGVFHCFTGTAAQAEKALSYEGFLLGIGGVVTYKKSDLGEVLETFPKNRVVLETDAPYLSPVPYRGKRNEPSYITEVVKKIAQCWKITEEEVASITTDNARKLFSI